METAIPVDWETCLAQHGDQILDFLIKPTDCGRAALTTPGLRAAVTRITRKIRLPVPLFSKIAVSTLSEDRMPYHLKKGRKEDIHIMLSLVILDEDVFICPGRLRLMLGQVLREVEMHDISYMIDSPQPISSQIVLNIRLLGGGSLSDSFRAGVSLLHSQTRDMIEHDFSLFLEGAQVYLGCFTHFKIYHRNSLKESPLQSCSF